MLSHFIAHAGLEKERSFLDFFLNYSYLGACRGEDDFDVATLRIDNALQWHTRVGAHAPTEKTRFHIILRVGKILCLVD